MSDNDVKRVRNVVDSIYRTESRRVFATLVRLLGNFDLAEEALSDAFAAALEKWPREGVPTNPRAWLVSAGRFKAIDAMRRRVRFDASLAPPARIFSAVWKKSKMPANPIAERSNWLSKHRSDSFWKSGSVSKELS